VRDEPRAGTRAVLLQDTIASVTVVLSDTVASVKLAEDGPGIIPFGWFAPADREQSAAAGLVINTPQAQQHGLPGIYQAALHPAASDLFGQLKASTADAGEAMAASRGLLAAG
jgi:hypothetical protein